MKASPVVVSGKNGSRLELTILGYAGRGPVDDEDDPYDANWLVVKASVVVEEGRWSFTDSCLLTWEVQALARWLALIAAGPTEIRSQDFTEELLRFTVRDWQEGAVVLCLELWLEGPPPWLRGGQDIPEPYSVDLVVLPDTLRVAASVLQERLDRFPPRAPVRG